MLPALLVALASLAGMALAQGQEPEIAEPPPAEQALERAAEEVEPAPPLVPIPPRGQRPIVATIRIEGQRRYTVSQLQNGLGVKVGDPLDFEQIERGIETLWKSFHVRAEVAMREVQGGVELRLSVVEVPVDIEPRFVGNDAMDDEELLEWAGMERGSEIFLYQGPRVRQRLLEGYRREGFYFAEVDIVMRGEDETSEETPDVIFQIREGPRVRVKGVLVEGNHSLPERGFWFWKDGLKNLAGVELKGWTLFNWWGKKFVEDALQADLLAMVGVYRDQGWLDAVVELDRLEFSDDRSKVWIHVIVDEGPRYVVTDVSIEGVERRPDPERRGEWIEEPAVLLFEQQELVDLLELEPGVVLEQRRVDSDRRALRDHYGERGYLSHPSLRGEDNWEFLEPQLFFDPDEPKVAVKYRIVQGRQRFIREILFEGATHTRDRVLRREITMQPGELADLKEINKSLASLQGTGYFTDEFRPLEHRDPTFRLLPTDDPDEVDLEYTVEEGRVVDFQIQGGVQSDNGLFGRLSLSMKNFDLFDWPSSFRSSFKEIFEKRAFHGAGQRLDIDIAPGTEINYYRIRFFEPDLFRTHYQRYSIDVEAARRLRGYDNYDEERSELSATLGRRFSRELSMFAGLTTTDLDVDDIDYPPLVGFPPPGEVNVPESLVAQEGESDLIGGTFSVRWRDLDNFLYPRKGVRASWNNALYGGVFGGDWDFAQSQLDLDFFVPMGGDEDEVRQSWRFGFRAGVAEPYGDSDLVPYSERFFLGGLRSLRGFDFRGVGPNVGDQPDGGQTMLGGTVEYRIPLYEVTQPGTFRQIEMFGMQLFYDWGVYDPESWQLDLDELRSSVGFGFSLLHPIPLSFNFGFPIRKGDGDDRETFSFSIAFY